MRPVLELEARPDTAEARRAGQLALGVSTALVLALVAAASVLAARSEAVPATSAPGTELPLLASGRQAAAAWEGAEAVGGRVLVATGSENGRVALIRGGSCWRDYNVRCRVRWPAGRRISLVVRATAPACCAAFVLEGRTVRLEETWRGETRTLATAAIPAYRGRSFDALVSVHGHDASLVLDGAAVLSGRLGECSAGTAGLGAWDPAWGAAGAEAEYFLVEPWTASAGGTKPPAEASPDVEYVDGEQ